MTADLSKFEEVISLLSTKIQADHLSSELDLLIADLYNTEKPFEQKLSNTLNHQEKEALSNMIQKHGVVTSDPMKFQEYLEELKEAIRSIPTMDVTIGIDPKDSLVSIISTWLKSNAKTRFILDFHKDDTCGGGAVVEFGGERRDFTIRKHLQNKFKKKEFSNLLKEA
jgi:F0F1-type ATP synthase delta subunit